MCSYVEAGWGWNDATKRSEMFDDAGRLVVATGRPVAPATAGDATATAADCMADAKVRDTVRRTLRRWWLGCWVLGVPNSCSNATLGLQDEVLGFLLFRLTLDGSDEEPVLYVYELQIVPGARRLGLGKHLMQVCSLFVVSLWCAFAPVHVAQRRVAPALSATCPHPPA